MYIYGSNRDISIYMTAVAAAGRSNEQIYCPRKPRFVVSSSSRYVLILFTISNYVPGINVLEIKGGFGEIRLTQFCLGTVKKDAMA